MVSHRGRVAPNRIVLPGTAEEAWDGWVELKHLPVADPLAWPSAVVVAAHPDDQILGAGGTLARLASTGLATRSGCGTGPSPVTGASPGSGPARSRSGPMSRRGR